MVVLIFICRLAGDENNHGLAMKPKIGTKQDFRDSRVSTKKKLPGGLTTLISTSIMKIGVDQAVVLSINIYKFVVLKNEPKQRFDFLVSRWAVAYRPLYRNFE
jgi:hypothetical protein